MSDPRGSVATEDQASSRRLISASAVMVSGTLLSRLLGFGRFALLVYLFGNATRQADMFAVANTVPNSMYILLAGGVLNTVLVPQIVRAIRTDRDGGEAYTNRILTGGLLALFGITLVLTLAVPLVVDLYTAAGWKEPVVAAQYASMLALAYYCMPQVFFYGVHVLVGQVLNARDRFGPMMWAPIANNVVSILVLLGFLVVFGRTDTSAAFTPGEELVLGIGSTLGIAVQAAVLIPYLRAVGFHFSPRFDFRHTGLGKTLRLAKWTLGFVLVTQAALVLINKVATAATIRQSGGGLAAYSNAYALWIVPHSLITVSLATAMLPSASRLAHAGDLPGTAAEITRTLRLAVTALLPAAVLFVVLGVPIARLIFGFGAGADDADFVGWTLMAFAVGLVPFTVQYICLRGFYALENTKTPFFLQVLISAVNVVLGVGIALYVNSPPVVAASLAIGYSLAYVVGVAVSYRRLRRDLPALAARPLVQLSARLLLAVLPGAAVAAGLVWWVEAGDPGQALRAVALLGGGVIAVLGFLVAARRLGIAEVSDILRTIRGASTEVAEDPGRTRQPPGSGDSDPGELVVSPSISSAGPAAPDPSSGAIKNADTMVTFAGPGRVTDAAAPLPPTAAAPEPEPNLPRSQVYAGTVLGGRYRLEELRAETARTVTWRAFDLVLSRSVLVHLLSPADPRADELLGVARRSAAATDSRFLRVLDAVPSSSDDVGAYLVCEYATGQTLEVLLGHGPLSGLEAAWVVREVADALSVVHGLGLYHERISPDTVVLTPDGHVKIVGLLIEAALRPASGGRAGDSPERADVTDLGRLLYACLVSRWPGGPAFGLPDAPSSSGHWLSPRQVRAGVSPALDAVCDQILGDPPRHRAPRLRTANDVVNALTKVLGSADASSDLERRLRQPIPHVTTTPPADAPNRTTGSTVASGPLPGTAPAVAAGATRVTVIRQPAPPSARPTAEPPVRRPRRWIALLIIMSLLLIATGVVAAVLQDRPRGGSQATGSPARGTSATPSGTASAAPGPVRIVGARAFDPQGDPPNDENSNEVRYAYDHNPATRWRTVQYLGNPRLGGLKRGVGLVLDLGAPHTVRSVRLQLSGNGTNVQVRVPKTPGVSKPPMNGDDSWRTVSRHARVRKSVTFTLKQPADTRFVLVYLTLLPKEGNGYRGGVYEVEVR